MGKMVALITVLLVGIIKADPAFFCAFKDNPDFSRVGDLDFYKQCGNRCDCKVQELVCLKSYENNDPDKVEFTLENESFQYASSCPQSECLCNNDRQRWSQQTKNANLENQEKALPFTPAIDIPPYEELEDFDSNIFNAITATNLLISDKAPVINNLINQGKPDLLTEVRSNPDFPTIESNCTSQASVPGIVTCDLHYQLDWNYRLTVAIQCDQLDSLDYYTLEEGPCFATQACICDNGFYRIVSEMPKKPSTEYAGIGNLLNLFQDQQAENYTSSADEDDSEDSDATVIVIAILVPIFLICIVVGLFVWFKYFRSGNSGSITKAKIGYTQEDLHQQSSLNSLAVIDIDGSLSKGAAESAEKQARKQKGDLENEGNTHNHLELKEPEVNEHNIEKHLEIENLDSSRSKQKDDLVKKDFAQDHQSPQYDHLPPISIQQNQATSKTKNDIIEITSIIDEFNEVDYAHDKKELNTIQTQEN